MCRLGAILRSNFGSFGRHAVMNMIAKFMYMRSASGASCLVYMTAYMHAVSVQCAECKPRTGRAWSVRRCTYKYMYLAGNHGQIFWSGSRVPREPPELRPACSSNYIALTATYCWKTDRITVIRGRGLTLPI